MVDHVQVASPQLSARRQSRNHYDLHLKELPAITISRDFVLSPGNKDMDQSEVFKQLNEVNPEDGFVPPAEILQSQGNHNHIENVTPSEELTPAILSTSSSSEEEEGSSGLQDDMISNEMQEIQKEQLEEEKEEEKELDEDGLFDDPELLETTEKNRHIPYHDFELKETSEKDHRKRDPRLIFTEPVVTDLPDRLQVCQYYGKTDEIYPRRRRVYMIACDFSRESIAALDWTLGTIMRDGEEVHVVTVVNGDEDTRKGSKLSPANELHVASIGVTDQAKSILAQMRLYDIKLVTTVIRGRPKEVLPNLINELPLTMVVCGCRGQSTMKEMLMGSISSFLLQKSSVPVSVVRYQKKKQKKGKKKPQAPQPLSKSVESGQLVVDELSSMKSS